MKHIVKTKGSIWSTVTLAILQLRPLLRYSCTRKKGIWDKTYWTPRPAFSSKIPNPESTADNCEGLCIFFFGSQKIWNCPWKLDEKDFTKSSRRVQWNFPADALINFSRSSERHGCLTWLEILVHVDFLGARIWRFPQVNETFAIGRFKTVSLIWWVCWGEEEHER